MGERVVKVWCGVVLAGVLWASPATADLYRYRNADGTVLVTTEKRQGLELIDVIRDDGSTEKPSAETPRKRRHRAARREAVARRTQARAATRPRDEPVALEQQPREARFDDIIQEAAEAYQMPSAFIKGVIKVESNFNPFAVSHVGAMGLMQLMPATARLMGVEDPFDPKQNIFGGTKLLRLLTNKYNGDINLLLSAYNAGEGAVDKHDGIPYKATREYVRKVYYYYKIYQREDQSAPAAPEVGAP